MVDVATGARGGDCCWVENSGPENFLLVYLTGGSSDELRSQGSGFYTNQEGKNPTPKKKLQLPNSIPGKAKLSTRMLGSRSCRQIALQATDTCTSRHVRLEISLQDAHCTHGPRKAAAARAPDEMQARCNPFVHR